MSKIKTIRFSSLRNEAHYQFLNLFRDLPDVFTAVKAVVAVLYEKFIALLAQESQLVDTMHGSAFSKQLADADHRVDRDMVGINSLVDTARHHFNPDISAAAEIIYLRMKAFGDIENKSYEEESAAVKLLLADLRGEYAAKAEMIGLLPWLDELEAAEEDFERLFKLRNTERANKPEVRLIDLRKEIDGVYRLMIDRISASAVLDETGLYTEFINELNREIEYANEHAHHHAKKDISGIAVEAIPVQAYTGKPVTVIPKAYYTREGKPDIELVFAADFTVTYKNNTKAGVADLLIHGKGAYNGEKTVTFNIV
jgi:hypothetical protein